jgi:hypothetical protein
MPPSRRRARCIEGRPATGGTPQTGWHGGRSVVRARLRRKFEPHVGQGRLRRILDLVWGSKLPPRCSASASCSSAAPCYRRAAKSCRASRTRSSPMALPSQGCWLCVLLFLHASVCGAQLPTAALALPLACMPSLTAHVLVLITSATVAAYPASSSTLRTTSGTTRTRHTSPRYSSP